MKQKGMTLIDFAVIISLFAILYVIARPVFGPPPRRGNVCMTNLKQIALATQVYLQEYDEWLPPACVANPAAPDPGDHVAAITWDELLQPYWSRTDIWRCPRDPLPKRVPARSYAANAWLLGSGYCHPDYRGFPRYALRYSELEAPHLLFLYGERFEKDRRRVVGRADFHITWSAQNTHPDRDGLPGSLFAFADGHVKWLHHGDPNELQYRWRAEVAR